MQGLSRPCAQRCVRITHPTPVSANRRPDHIVDPWRTGGQHHQPVKAKRNPACGGHQGQSGKEILVHRIAFAVNPFLFVHLGGEAAALFGGVGQFAKAIGQFHPAGVNLEPLRLARVIGAGAGKRGLGRFSVQVDDADARRALGHGHFSEKRAEAKRRWKVAQTGINRLLGEDQVVALHALIDASMDKLAPVAAGGEGDE